MQLRDPTNETEPNFEEAGWEGTREAIMAGGKSLEEAIVILREGWQVRHERDLVAWNEHLRLHQQEAEREREEGQGDGITPVDEQPSDSEEPEWANKPTPTFLDIKPARHILKKLEKKEFIELWHFTAEGCRDAAAVDLATPDGSYGLVDTGKGLVFQTIGASSSSSKVIKDEDLTWNQLTEAKTRMIGCSRACGWSKFEVSQLVLFYLSLDVHPIRSQPYGLETVMRYQSRVRRDWTEKLRTGNPYSIANVNDGLMKECPEEIRNEAQARNNVSLWVSQSHLV